MNAACGCSDDALCSVAKRLWKRRNLAGRIDYSKHRTHALGLDHINGYGIRANNVTADGVALPLPK